MAELLVWSELDFTGVYNKVDTKCISVLQVMDSENILFSVQFSLGVQPHHTAVILLWVHSRDLSRALPQPSMATRCFCVPQSNLGNICSSGLLQQDIPCVGHLSAAG